MTQAVSLYANRVISPDDYAYVVYAVGGQMIAGSPPQYLQSVLTERDRAIWPYLANPVREVTQPGIMKQIRDNLGGDVQSEIYVEISREERSALLMVDFLGAIIRQFPDINIALYDYRNNVIRMEMIEKYIVDVFGQRVAA